MNRNTFSDHRLIGYVARLALAAAFSSCSGSDPTMDERAGKVELRLIDAPADDVKEIVVTIARVEAHAAGSGWTTLASEEHTVDLLKLQGGTFASLGVTSLPPGKITQFRLYVKEGSTNYVTTPDGAQHPLKVPSGEESGIKIQAGFAWPACAYGNMTLDFDGKKSIFVHPTGREDQWILRPVIRLASVNLHPGMCDAPMPPSDGGGGGSGGSTGTAGSGGGTSAPPREAPPMMEPTPAPPPPNACADVVCAEPLFCYNGACVPIIE